MIDLKQGDCLELMKEIADHSVDAIICDLPYGTSACDFDKELIDLNLLWNEYRRIIKPNRAIVLFSQQPFTTKLIISNLDQYKYSWIWQKDNGTNFLNSHYQPLKITEDICVFGDGATSFSNGEHLFYNPQFSVGKSYSCISGKQKDNASTVRGKRDVDSFLTENNGVRYPTNILKFNRDKEKLHPTQKPVELLEYLIKTYSNENDTILDNCMGSGTTGVACVNTNRSFIGIEKDPKYFEIAKDRISKASCEQEKLESYNEEW